MKNKRTKIIVAIIIAILLIFIIFIFSKMFLTNKSYIITENGTKVFFNVPNTLKEEELSDDEVRMFSKQIGSHSYESIIITVLSYDFTVNEYMEYVLDIAQEVYENAKFSKIETKVVNNITFFYRTVTHQYRSTGTTEYNTYICCELDDTDEIYMVEIDGKEQLTEKEIDMLLNISIK